MAPHHRPARLARSIPHPLLARAMAVVLALPAPAAGRQQAGDLSSARTLIVAGSFEHAIDTYRRLAGAGDTAARSELLGHLIAGRASSHRPDDYSEAIIWLTQDSSDAARPGQADRAQRLLVAMRLLRDKLSAAVVHAQAATALAATADSTTRTTLAQRMWLAEVTLGEGLADDGWESAIAQRVREVERRKADIAARAEEGQARVDAARQRSVGRTGARYRGGLERGKPVGPGSMDYADGSLYQGHFKDGRFEGRGTFDSPTGNRYDGEYHSSREHGRGTFEFASGARYAGDFVNGTRTGQGTFETATGERYIGQFVENRFHGHGVLEYQDGGRYDGEWSEGKRQGRGTEEYASGRVLTGRFENDRYVGK